MVSVSGCAREPGACRPVHLQEEGAERGIRWRTSPFDFQRLGENGVMADGKAFKVPLGSGGRCEGWASRPQKEPIPG